MGILLPVVLWAGSVHAIEGTPGNDSCTRATIVSATPFADALLTTDATIDPGDPHPSCGNESNDNSVWYRFTVPSAGTVTVSTLGSDYDTILSVYDGSCESLSSLPDGCNDDDPRDGAQSTVTFKATAGTTYFFMVSAFDGDGGSLTFETRLRAAPLCVGDCDGNGILAPSECALCSMIRDGEPLALCPPCDVDGDGQVAVREVNQCLLGVEDCISCVGDCDGSGRVTASDLVTAASLIVHCPCTGNAGGIAAGCPALPTVVASCSSADPDGDSCLSESELERLAANIFSCSP